MALQARHVTLGGVWHTTPTLWQRYDRAWDGPLQTRGPAVLLGSIAIVYDTPTTGSIIVYRAALTEYGVSASLTVEGLCDEAFSFAGLTLASCPRAELQPPPRRDPFYPSPALQA
jgi:hypothetical protein